MAAAVAPVREVRGVRDKFTGAPRGFCFLHLFSIADAARVMQLLQARAFVTRTAPGSWACWSCGRGHACEPCTGSLWGLQLLPTLHFLLAPASAGQCRRTGVLKQHMQADNGTKLANGTVSRRMRAWRARSASCACATRASAPRLQARRPMRSRCGAICL